MAQATTTSDLDAIEEEVRSLAGCPPSDLVARLDGMLDRLPTSSPPDQVGRHISLIIEIAGLCYFVGKAARGIPVIALAVMHAESYGDRPLLRRALSVQGLILATTGSTSLALASLRRALDIGEALGDRVGIGAVWLNIASAYAEMALWRDCLHANARVVDLAKAMPETHHRRGYLLDRAWHGLAIAQYNLQQHSAAAEACECAIAAIVDTADPMEALVLTAAEATFTFVLLRLERLQEAKVHAAACVSAALTAGTGRADLVARLASGLVDVYVGEVEAGITRLEAALSDAIAIGPSQYDEALRVLVLAHEKAGRPERALHYQRELIRHSLEAQAAHIRDTLITQQAVADGQATRVDPYAPQALASLQARLAALLDRPHRSVGARLRRLNDLWEEKMITREESAEQRARILAQL